MQTKLEVTLTHDEAEEIVGADVDYTTGPGRQVVAEELVERLGLGGDAGGWYWKASYPKEGGGMKMTARFVAAGTVVVV